MQVQDLFISGQEGYHTYCIPALAVAPDGAVLAFCEARRHTGRDDDQIDILLRRSTDAGALGNPANGSSPMASVPAATPVPWLTTTEVRCCCPFARTIKRSLSVAVRTAGGLGPTLWRLPLR